MNFELDYEKLKTKYNYLVELELNNNYSFNNNYTNTYPYLRNFAQDLKFNSIQDLVVLSHVVYGWMPTILNFNFINSKEVLEIIRSYKKSFPIDMKELFDQLTELKLSINNSIVGTSKLLHFIYPNQFPIWDSRIARELYNINSQYKVNNIDSYLKYYTDKHYFISQSENQTLFKKIKNHFTYEISDIRAVEFVLFSYDKETRRK